MVENNVLLTCRDGLAYVVGSGAGPTKTFRSYTRNYGSTTGAVTSEYSISSTGITWWRNWWNTAYTKWLARMAKGRSNANQQLMEKQDGQWHTETTRKCRSLHHSGTINRRCNSRHRLLVIRQLLVSGSRNGSGNGGLTSAKRSSKPWRAARSSRRHRGSRGHVFRRRRGKLVSWGPIFEPGERLATRRGIRKRCPKSLTSRLVRKEWCRGYG
ncbi:uncharacterized protein LOC143197064 [Rhynchophorus ferrugineus]|uniref:uncharacterized protein LOC143197064 n=1 Tax=Rhynchophorus ferrugineus TaxID=354439 RepID=UPI003FCC87B9